MHQKLGQSDLLYGSQLPVDKNMGVNRHVGKSAERQFMLAVLGLLLCPGRGAEYCDQLVCLCVCLSVCEHFSGTAGPSLTKLSAQVPCGRGSVLLWRRCDTLCTSGFMDDVTFGRNWPYGDAIPGRSLMSTNALFCLFLCFVSIRSVVFDCFWLSVPVQLIAWQDSSPK